MKAAESAGTKAFLCTHWADGGKGIEALARQVVDLADSGQVQVQAALSRRHAAARQGQDHRHRDLPRHRHRLRYQRAQTRFKELQAAGYGHLPVCMAKTQYSFSTDPNRKGAPTGHVVPIRELQARPPAPSSSSPSPARS